jgi:hypothetical protein
VTVASTGLPTEHLEVPTPEPGVPVRVIAHGRVSEALVEATAEGQWTLALAAVPAALHEHRVCVEFVAGEGVWRLLGVLAPIDDRRMHFAFADVPQLLLRRRHVRAPLRAPVRAEWADGCFGEHETVDVSAGGLLIAGPIECAPGDLLKVTLVLARRPAICASARVARVTEDGEVGIEFLDIDEGDRSLLALAALAVRDRL